jgi:hypothetical protein
MIGTAVKCRCDWPTIRGTGCDFHGTHDCCAASNFRAPARGDIFPLPRVVASRLPHPRGDSNFERNKNYQCHLRQPAARDRGCCLERPCDCCCCCFTRRRRFRGGGPRGVRAAGLLRHSWRGGPWIHPDCWSDCTASGRDHRFHQRERRFKHRRLQRFGWHCKWNRVEPDQPAVYPYQRAPCRGHNGLPDHPVHFGCLATQCSSNPSRGLRSNGREDRGHRDLYTDSLQRKLSQNAAKDAPPSRRRGVPFSPPSSCTGPLEAVQEAGLCP